MTIAVTGATGQLGRLIIEGLKASTSESIIALARSPEKAADLGVESRVADYTKPETLAPALAGVDTLMFISASDIGQRVQQHLAVIEAVKTAGVKHVVYTSLLNADKTGIPFAPEHTATEAAIKESGATYTLLRNGWYSENYVGSSAGAVANGAFVGSAGDGRVSGATRADYAAAAVKVLTTEGHENKTYELAGDIAFTLTDLAAEISAQTGKTIPYTNLPVPEYAAILKTVGLPEEMAEMFAGLELFTAADDLYSESKELSQLIGRPTTPLADVVKAVLA